MIALLDTNAYTALVRGDVALLEGLNLAERILMSSIVVGELEYGFRFGNRYQSNREILDEFLAESFVDFLTLTRDTTLAYGAISSELRKSGKKIPTNDAWIAAHCKEQGAELWTRDKHFGSVPGLVVRGW